MRHRRGQRHSFSHSKCGARWRWVVNSTFRQVYSLEITLETILKKANRVPRFVWKDREKRGTLAPHRGSKCELSSSLLYRILYPYPAFSNKSCLPLPEEVHFELRTKELEKENLDFKALYQFRLFDVIYVTDRFEKYDSSPRRGKRRRIILNVYNLLKKERKER